MTNAEYSEALTKYRVYHEKYGLLGEDPFWDMPVLDYIEIGEILYKLHILHQHISPIIRENIKNYNDYAYDREVVLTRRLAAYTKLSDFEWCIDYLTWWYVDLEEEEHNAKYPK